MIVTVTRTGGFAGISRSGELDTAAVSDGDKVEQAVQAIDVTTIPDNQPQPDRYQYRLQAGETQLTVAEQDLDPQLAWLVNRVLE